jgi:glycosyltransferase involved in cell wall biosynthesis
MKILFVHAIGKSKFGGGEKWVLSAAKGLQERGHTVYLGCRPYSVLQARAEERGISVRPLNIISNISPYNIMKLALFLRNEKIDVVVSKNRDFSVAGVAAYFAGTPVVIARHGLPLRRNIKKNKFLLSRFAHGIIVNAQSTKDLYIKKGWFSGDFITVIYNGIDLDITCDPMPFETMYPGKKIILSIGRLSPQKGFTYLVDAAAILKNERDDFLIIVLGEGKLRHSLLQRARSAGVEKLIQFPGFVKSVGPYIRGCDFFVLPSLYEGLSNAALEAMACGNLLFSVTYPDRKK